MTALLPRSTPAAQQVGPVAVPFSVTKLRDLHCPTLKPRTRGHAAGTSTATSVSG
jgi:hypothetical protein